MPKSPLPLIDQLVDATVRYSMLSFLDAYNGYHQIFIDTEDAIKTAFTIGNAVYYCICMPFGLKNARASFERAMTRVFANYISRNLEAYVEDIMVRSMVFFLHLEHLKETLAS